MNDFGMMSKLSFFYRIEDKNSVLKVHKNHLSNKKKIVNKLAKIDAIIFPLELFQ